MNYHKMNEHDYNSSALLKMTLVATLSSFLCGDHYLGYQLGVFNTCQENVAETFKWGPDKEWYISTNTALMPVGALLGSVSGGQLANSLGRRRSMLLNNCITVLASALVLST